MIINHLVWSFYISVLSMRRKVSDWHPACGNHTLHNIVSIVSIVTNIFCVYMYIYKLCIQPELHSLINFQILF